MNRSTRKRPLRSAQVGSPRERGRYHLILIPARISLISGLAIVGAVLWCLGTPRWYFAEDPASPQVSIGPTVEISRSHGWCWFPTVHKFRSGEILASMVLSPDQINGESAVSAYCLSRDGGMTWSRRYTMGQGANQDGAWSEVPDENDMFWQFGSYPEPQREGATRDFYATLTKFGRGGRYSCEDRDIAIHLSDPAFLQPAWLSDYWGATGVAVPDTRFTVQFHGRPWGNIIRKGTGAYLCTAYFTAEQDREREEQSSAGDPRHEHMFNRTVLLRSTDGGKTWTEHGVIASLDHGEKPAWVGREGFNEGSLALLPDGRLYAVYRTTGGHDGTIGNGWSSDGGKTWTAPASIGFQGVAPRIHRLSNGMLVLVTGRPGPVTLRFNPDGRGENWTSGVTIYSEMSTRYTDVVEVQPGKLLVVYDHVPYGWYEIPFADTDSRNIIYGTFVTLQQER